MKFQVEKLDQFTGHRDSVYNIIPSFNSDTEFISCAGDGMVVKWNTEKPDLGYPIAKVDNSIYSIYLDKELNELWIGHNYEGLHVADPIRKKELASIALSKAAIFTITGYKENIYVGSGDGVITVIDKASRSFRKHIKASESNVRSIAINPVEKQFAAGFSDHKIRIFDLESFELIQVINAHSNSIFGLKYNLQFNTLYSVGRDARVKKWDVLRNHELIDEAVGHMYTINDITFSPSGAYFATCSMDKSIKLWETEGFKLRKVLDQSRFAAHGTSINRLLWLKEDLLLACSDDRSISMWRITPIID